jgi:hypothetical protein
MQYLHLIIEETSILGKLNAYVMQTPPNVYLKKIPPKSNLGAKSHECLLFS